MLLDDPGEFHPYAFCAWRRAGLDPWFQLNQILEWLGLDRVPPQTVAGEVLERDEPWDESQEGQEANRPEDLPVPANADKRYEELCGG